MHNFITKLILLAATAGLVSCETMQSFRRPAGWPVTQSADAKAVRHMRHHLRDADSASLTHAEKALLTFLNQPKNAAAAAGKKVIPGAHEWTVAEIYRVDPGKHLSVLCENGYQQKPIYFHYEESDATWYRVSNLETKHGRGVPAVKVQQ